MNFRGKRPVHIIDFLFVLSLFCVFTVSAFLIVIVGANVYRSTVKNMENTYSTRTALSYVTEKIRRHDGKGLIRLVELDGTPALAFCDSTDKKDYITYIYSNGTSLLEFTAGSDMDVSADMGKEVISVRNFTISEKEDGLFCLSAEDTDGNISTLYVHPQTSSGSSGITPQ